MFENEVKKKYKMMYDVQMAMQLMTNENMLQIVQCRHLHHEFQANVRLNILEIE